MENMVELKLKNPLISLYILRRNKLRLVFNFKRNCIIVFQHNATNNEAKPHKLKHISVEAFAPWT
jgi:hypothetical protein